MQECPEKYAKYFINGLLFFFFFFFFFCFWENKLRKMNTNKAGNNISMQNKLDMLFQPSRVIGRPNHSIMEYSLLSRCNHKARLDG